MILRLLFLLLVGIGLSMSPVTAQNQDTTIYKIVEEMPRFPGCENPDSSLQARKKCADQRLLEYVYSRMIYPVEAQQQNIEGTVVITFVVEKDGSLSQGSIARDLGGGTGQAALQLLSYMEREGVRWIPGRQSGQTVRTQINLPVKFKLQEALPYTLVKGDTVHVAFDKALDFTGGAEALQQFLASKLSYPAAMQDSCRIGQVDIKALIYADNSVRILDMIDYNNLGFDFWYEAANAVTWTAGKWIPARYGEAAVNASIDISLSFEPTAEVCKPVLTKYAEAVKLADEGSALITAEKYEEGIAKLSAALAIFPLDGKFLLLRGQAYLDTSKLAEACTDLRLARYITLVDWYDSIIALCK